MRIEQTWWTENDEWQPHRPGEIGGVQLVLAFASTAVLKRQDLAAEIRRAYPDAHLFGCTTAGEICGTRVWDDSLVVTAISLEHTTLKGARERIGGAEESFQVGAKLAGSLDKEGLVHALVLSEGLNINGSDLVAGLREHLPEDVTVTGGLSADGTRHGETLVVWDGPAEPDTVGLVGFYGDRLKVGYGSLGGWDPFGPERLVTRSEGNVIYELDGKSALDLYKLYLGEHADELPASAMLFPLSVRTSTEERPLVRTILSIDGEEQSMTFAGAIPTGSYARFMKANFDRLIDGAVAAARTSHQALGTPADLAILISCVGRKAVLKQRIEEEVEGVREALGEAPVLAGFYSYGEISPFARSAKCELHNQTMTITTMSER